MKHTAADSENPITCDSQIWPEAAFTNAKQTQHTWEELKSEKSHKHACLSTSGKRAETNPVRPCGTAALLCGTREQTGRSLRIIWQRKGLGFRTLGQSHTHSNIPRWDTPRRREDAFLYLKWNAGLQGALWHTGDREQGEVHGDALGAHGGHGLLGLRKEAQDIDRVSPYKLLRLPRPAV